MGQQPVAMHEPTRDWHSRAQTLGSLFPFKQRCWQKLNRSEQDSPLALTAEITNKSNATQTAFFKRTSVIATGSNFYQEVIRLFDLRRTLVFQDCSRDHFRCSFC
jgi:hypothetical protein